MAKKEANFDLYIHDLLVEAGIQADTQGSNVFEINNALKTASKHQTIGLGTIINTAAIVIGGLLGYFFGRLLIERIQDTLNMSPLFGILFL